MIINNIKLININDPQTKYKCPYCGYNMDLLISNLLISNKNYRESLDTRRELGYYCERQCPGPTFYQKNTITDDCCFLLKALLLNFSNVPWTKWSLFVLDNDDDNRIFEELVPFISKYINSRKLGNREIDNLLNVLNRKMKIKQIQELELLLKLT